MIPRTGINRPFRTSLPPGEVWTKQERAAFALRRVRFWIRIYTQNLDSALTLRGRLNVPPAYTLWVREQERKLRAQRKAEAAIVRLQESWS